MFGVFGGKPAPLVRRAGVTPWQSSTRIGWTAGAAARLHDVHGRPDVVDGHVPESEEIRGEQGWITARGCLPVVADERVDALRANQVTREEAALLIDVGDRAQRGCRHGRLPRAVEPQVRAGLGVAADRLGGSLDDERNRQGARRDELHVRVHELVLVRQVRGRDLESARDLAARRGLVTDEFDVAGVGDVLAGHQVVIDLLLPLGHLQHRLLVGPVGLQGVQRWLRVLGKMESARLQIRIDEQPEVRRLAHQFSRERNATARDHTGNNRDRESRITCTPTCGAIAPAPA